jgi:hypothetical protein
MNTEEARVKTGIQQGIGLSTEKIVAYHRRFPTPAHL